MNKKDIEKALINLCDTFKEDSTEWWYHWIFFNDLYSNNDINEINLFKTLWEIQEILVENNMSSENYLEVIIHTDKQDYLIVRSPNIRTGC